MDLVTSILEKYLVGHFIQLSTTNEDMTSTTTQSLLKTTCLGIIMVVKKTAVNRTQYTIVGKGLFQNTYMQSNYYGMWPQTMEILPG